MKSLTRLSLLLMIPALGWLTPSSAQARSRWQGFAVSPSTDNQEQPDIHNNIIVWQELIAQYGDYDICVADLNNPGDPLFLLIGDANDQTNPAVYDNVVVWQDFVVWGGPGDWDIRAVDFSNRADPRGYIVTDIANNDEMNPAISGNIVTWQDGAEGDFDIYGADITDLTNPLEFPIANFQRDQQRPAIYRTTVVWQDTYFGDWDILGSDIWQRNKPTDFGVARFEKDQQAPAISGNIVVWQDNYYGDWDIYAAPVSSVEDRNGGDPNKPVGFPVAAREGSQINPDIDGHIVVWQDDRNGNWDIYGYNLTTRREFQITDERHDQTNPAISGNIVVWQDKRNGTWQIYAVLLDGPEVAQCTARPDGDLNGDCTTDFTDYALMAASWLDCGFEPKDACPQ